MLYPVVEEALEKTIDEVKCIVHLWKIIVNKLTGIDCDKLISMFNNCIC
jgi:hypothetical protein